MNGEPLPTTILLVDDDRDLREALLLALEVAGYVVIAERSGEDALQRLTARLTAQLLIIDADLPGIDGEAAIREIHQLAPLLPVIAMSCQERASSMLAAGARVFLAKPLEMSELLANIDALLSDNREEVEL